MEEHVMWIDTLKNKECLPKGMAIIPKYKLCSQANLSQFIFGDGSQFYHG